MATFQITGPDGKKYRVSGESADGALQALQKHVAPTGQPEAPDQGDGFLRNVDSFVRGAADMATFGLADEISAGLGAATGLGGDFGDYSGNLARQRGEQEMRDKNDPVASTLGRVAGGVGSALGLARGGIGLTARLSPSAGLGKRVAAGAAEGAAFGGAYGLGSGEGAGGRLKEGAQNAALGAAFGGAFPVVAQGVASGTRAALNSRAAQAVAKKTGVSPEVMRMLGSTMQADGTLGRQGSQNMQRAGKEAMLADAGPNARAILDTSIQRGGPGAVSAQRAISERAARGASDITKTLDDTLGKPVGVTASQTAIRDGSRAARSTAYDAAYSSPINYADPHGQAIERIVKTRVPQAAINEANALMRAKGETSKQILANVADDGSIVFETLPDVRQLDYLTRGLNEVADQADGMGKLGGTTAKGQAYSDLLREIRGHLKELVPEYGNALETAADPIRRSKAVELGSKLLSPSMTRDQVSEAVKGMTGPEKAALTQGIRSRIDDALANVTRTAQDGDVSAREAVKAIKDFSSRANREKLATAIGDKAANKLFEEMDRVATSFDLRASVTENSKTFARQATARRIEDMTAPGPVGTVAQGEPINATKRIVQLLTGQTPEKVQGRQDAIYSQLAKVLTEPRQNAAKTFAGMNELSQKEIQNAMVANMIKRGLGRAQMPAVYPTSNLLADKLRQ